MAKKIYKVDSFGCTLSTRKKFEEQLQECIDKNAAEGWVYRDLTAPGAIGEMCVVIFEKDAEEA